MEIVANTHIHTQHKQKMRAQKKLFLFEVWGQEDEKEEKNKSFIIRKWHHWQSPARYEMSCELRRRCAIEICKLKWIRTTNRFAKNLKCRQRQFTERKKKLNSSHKLYYYRRHNSKNGSSVLLAVTYSTFIHTSTILCFSVFDTPKIQEKMNDYLTSAESKMLMFFFLFSFRCFCADNRITYMCFMHTSNVIR